MSLAKIAWRSIQQRALSSWLTGLSMALGVALVVIVLVIHGVVARSFSEAAQGFHLILGAKGGKLQLVLNTVFHLSEPIENLPWSFYKEFTEFEDDEGFTVRGRYARNVEVVVPYCLGDSYKDMRVVGTNADLFGKLAYGSLDNGDLKYYKFREGGRNLKNENFYEAVIGSVAAARTGLKLGDRFPITHGLPDDTDPHVHEDEKFEVVGILEPTGTPNDRAIFVNMEGFYLFADHAKPVAAGEEHDHGHGHDHGKDEGDAHKHDEDKAHKHDEDKAHKHEEHAAHEKHAGHEEHHEHGRAVDADGNPLPLPDAQREVTALLVLMKDDFDAHNAANHINEGNVAQAVFPQREVAILFDGIVGNVQLILLVLSVLVVIVAGIGVMVSIYNSMSDRSREIAVMRSLGAGRSTVMAIVLLESIMLSLFGGAAGVLIGHAAIAVMGPYIVAQTGVAVGMLHFETIEFALIPGLVALASLVGYLPAVAAYRTDVARALSATP